jgi:hypothetical protein
MRDNREHRSAERPHRKGAWQDREPRLTETQSPYITELHGERGAPWRDEQACHVSTLRVRIKSDMANQLEQLFTGPIVPAWRDLQARGELLAVTLVRVEAAEDQYDLVAQWASKDAHDGNVDRFVAEVYGLVAACYMCVPP